MALRREKIVKEDLELGTGSATWTADDGSSLTGTKIDLDAFAAYRAAALKIGAATAPDAAAILELVSTTQGLLVPRMTTAQRDAISAPPAGLIVYNTTTNKLNVRVAAAWEAVTSA